MSTFEQALDQLLSCALRRKKDAPGDADDAVLSLGAGLPAWGRTAVFVFGTALLLIGCAVAALRHRWPAPSLVGLALVLGGGASNLVDRVARGAVIDFLNVGVGSLRTGIFNVADMAIVLGIGLLLFTHDRPRRRVSAKQ